MRPGDGSLFAADTGGEDHLLRLIDLDSPLNFVPLNVADNWLHLALGLGLLATGLALVTTSPRPTAGATSSRASSSRAFSVVTNESVPTPSSAFGSGNAKGDPR